MGIRTLVLAGVLAAVATNVAAIDFTVNAANDAVDAAPGNGVCAAAGGGCTLRAAIQEANALAGDDRVLLPAGTFTLTIAGTDEDAAAAGDLDVTDPLTIEGAGPGATIVDADGVDRVFDVGVAATIRGLTIMRGDAGGSNGGGIFSAPFGADFTLTVERVHFTTNAALHGGAIQNEAGSTLVVRQSSFSASTATFGAAIENQESAELENATVSGNGGGSGGGLRNDGELSLEHVTVVGDTIVSSSAFATRASVFDAGAGGTICSGATMAISGGENVERGTSCALADPSDQSGVDPLLGALVDAGDGTRSHALLGGSPAIDSVTTCPPPSEDQRGVMRPIDGDLVAGAACDAGAIEAPVAGGTTTSTSTSTTSTTSTSTTVTSTTSTSTTTTTIPGTTTSTSTTLVSTTTSTTVATSTTTTTSVPGSSTTTTLVTTTTTIGGSTTTTTLPPGERLVGRKLLLGDSATKPAKRKLVVLAKDAAITLGGGNGSADDPVQNGGSLRVRAVGGDGFDATYPLDGTGWAYVKGEGNDRGYKFRRGTPVRKIVVKPGKSIKVVAKGDALQHTLATQPDGVQVEIRLGDHRYCLEFGGTPAFKPNKRYRATNASAPTGCLSDAPAP